MNPVPRVELAVGAIVEQAGCLLLVQRGRGVGAGRWAPPGGRVEFGEHLRAAVAREVREETGLTVAVGELAGWVERIGAHPPERYHYVIFDFWATAVGAHVPVAGDDAADARWVPKAELSALPLVEGLFDFLVSIGSVPPRAGAATPARGGPPRPEQLGSDRHDDD
jgi:ADP-ribose pyrophosphatase YjhB (NUDIX family)